MPTYNLHINGYSMNLQYNSPNINTYDILLTLKILRYV